MAKPVQALDSVQFLLNEGFCQACTLSNSDLSGLDLTDVNLSHAILTNANLTGANLSGANLSGANLSGANLSGADLTNANLTNANLDQVNLIGARLNNTNLAGANVQISAAAQAPYAVESSYVSAYNPPAEYATPPISPVASAAPTQPPPNFGRVLNPPKQGYQPPTTVATRSAPSIPASQPQPIPTQLADTAPDQNIGGADEPNPTANVLTTDGIGIIDGGTVPKGRLLVSLKGGPQGLHSTVRYGILGNLEALGYLDYSFGFVDESEQGFGLKYRFLDQAKGKPLTISAAVNIALTGETFINYATNNRNEFRQRGLTKAVPTLFQGVNGDVGNNLIYSFSLPIHYNASDKLNLWLTPTFSYVQDRDIAVGGFNFGASYEVVDHLNIIAEVGANFAGRGNTFIGNTLEDAIPWNVGLRYDSSTLFGFTPGSKQLIFDLYASNRVGTSPWNQLRVRDQDEPTVGVGVHLLW
ncbi:pentapeptide repeat-containing protein [Acaryochloris sp. IP29b_bin.137]|uniref:pentapeptide repeat-containing protein n=1 Tax=Acaryochloris sp. IP29b_bin.137 TaxID=2969217 RepID=UPI0026282B76|nr:pentapeptide repeat-containing protein [Acaryochloris sp. IP29b_bin.137]